MTLAISNIAWQTDEQEAVQRRCDHWGVKALEMAPTKLWADPYDQPQATVIEARKKMEGQGLAVVALQALLYGRPDLQLFGTGPSRQDLLAYLIKAIRFSTWLGARVLVLGSPKNRLKGELSPEAVETIGHDFFSHLGAAAQEHGVMVCLEANPRAYGADYICTTAEAVRLVRAVASEGLKVNLDLGTMTINQERYNQIKLWMPVVGHVHVSEPYLEPVPQPGTDHKGFAAALKQAGFQGVCSLEMKAAATGSNLTTVDKALSTLRGIYGQG